MKASWKSWTSVEPLSYFENKEAPKLTEGGATGDFLCFIQGNVLFSVRRLQTGPFLRKGKCLPKSGTGYVP
jgi:hypothetical protein